MQELAALAWLASLAILCLVIKGRYLPGHWIIETLSYIPQTSFSLWGSHVWLRAFYRRVALGFKIRCIFFASLQPQQLSENNRAVAAKRGSLTSRHCSHSNIIFAVVHMSNDILIILMIGLLLALLLEHEEWRNTTVIISLFDQLRVPDDVDVHTFLSCESLKSLKKRCFYKQNRLLAFHCYENIIVQIDDSIFCRKHRSGPKTTVIVTYSASMN